MPPSTFTNASSAMKTDEPASTRAQGEEVCVFSRWLANWTGASLPRRNARSSSGSGVPRASVVPPRVRHCSGWGAREERPRSITAHYSLRSVVGGN